MSDSTIIENDTILAFHPAAITDEIRGKCLLELTPQRPNPGGIWQYGGNMNAIVLSHWPF